MATFNCPDCGNIVSDSAATCPRCNRPVTDADRQIAQANQATPGQPGSGIVSPNTGGPNKPPRKGGSSDSTQKTLQKRLLRILKWLLILLGVLIALGVISTALQTPEQKAEREQARIESAQREEARKAAYAQTVPAMEKAIYAKVSNTGAYGDYSLELKSSSDTNFSATIIFDNGPMPRRDAELLAKTVVHLMLKELIRLGRAPADEYINVHAHLYTRATGATGKQGYHAAGHASYDYNGDVVRYTPK